jgi:hypothetical protein
MAKQADGQQHDYDGPDPVHVMPLAYLTASSMAAGASESTCSPRGICVKRCCGVQSGRCLMGSAGCQVAVH